MIIVRISPSAHHSTNRRRIAAERKDDTGITHFVAGDADQRGEFSVWELRTRVQDQGRDCEFLAAESFGLIRRLDVMSS